MNPHTHHDESASNPPLAGDCMPTDLSAAARERKAAMLTSLQGELRARRTRRMLVRGGSVGALLLATATLVWVVQRPLPQRGVGVGPIASTPTRIGRSHDDSKTIDAAPKLTITHIQTDPTILDRLATKPSLNRIEQIGDDELLQAMHDAGKPAGLIRANGTLTIVEQRDARTVVGG